jgi:solute carrier family 25 (mitochondrial phosphate transporter), member 3
LLVSLFLFLSFFFFFFVFIITLLFKKTNLYFFAGTTQKHRNDIALHSAQSQFRSMMTVNKDLYTCSKTTMEALQANKSCKFRERTDQATQAAKALTGFQAHSKKEYGLDYFLRGALSGGICCAITHGALTPVDVVKTRMQLDPAKYSGMISGARKIAAEEGAGALLTGLAPTCFGYFVQGWFKFGGVEYFKIQAVKTLGEQKAWDNKTNIYLGAAAGAEFIADIFLCPLEATRIRLVSNPSYASSMPAAMTKMAAEEGIVNAFYSGFGPILAKQIPYTMAKFAVQGAAADELYKAMGKTNKECTSSENLSVSLGSGVIAGVSAAIISHPADTLLSKINKSGAGGSGSMISRLSNIVAETGMFKLATQGLAARCIMIGTLTAGQFGIFDVVMEALGASKFHFHDPSDASAAH